MKADCTELDDEKLEIQGSRESRSGRKIAGAFITGTFHGDSYKCDNADFYAPEDRTQAQDLTPAPSSSLRCSPNK